MGDSAISWTNKTWNPVVGCNQVSPGCANCYAKTLHDMRHRAHLAGKKMAAQYAVPFEHVQTMPERLEYPLRWRKPQKIFVNSVSDLFHEDVPVEFIAKVFNIMACATLSCRGHRWADHTDECWTGEPHTFQILTKRPDRMRQVVAEELPDYVFNYWPGDSPLSVAMEVNWPLPNVWLGTSVENQRWANERIPLLLKTPAAVRFLSCEPLLSELDIRPFLYRAAAPVQVCPVCLYFTNQAAEEFCPNDGAPLGPDIAINWVIAGGESGPKRREMPLDAARSLRDQCVAAGVPFFFKQMGGRFSETDKELDGQRWEQMPV